MTHQIRDALYEQIKDMSSVESLTFFRKIAMQPMRSIGVILVVGSSDNSFPAYQTCTR